MDNFTLILSVNNTFKYYFKYCLLNFLSLLAFYTRTTASLSSPWTQTFCSDHSAQWTKYFLSPLKRFFFITLACLFGGGGKFHNLHLEVRSNVKKLVLSFYHVSLWGSNSDSQSWGKCPCFMRWVSLAHQSFLWIHICHFFIIVIMLTLRIICVHI